MLIAGLGWILLLVSFVSLMNHSGINFEWGGSPRAVQGLRLRGSGIAGAILLIGWGFASSKGMTGEGETLRLPVIVIASIGVLFVVAFAAYKPKTAPSEAIADSAPAAHSRPDVRLNRSSVVRWLALFAGGVIAGTVLIIFSLPIGLG